MAKDTTETFAPGKFGNVLLAPVGTAPPADFETAFADPWFNVGWLEDQPDVAKSRTTAEVIPWNSPEAIAEILDTETNEFTIKPMQLNRTTFELYFGPSTFTPEGDGVLITPDDAADQIEKVLALELLDGSKVFRIFWARCTVGSVGAMSMPRDGLISFELTLKRLQATSGPNWWKQTNLVGLVSA